MKQPPAVFCRGLRQQWQTIYKPGSVGKLSQSGRSFLYEHGHPCSLAAYPRCLDRGGLLSPHIWPCSSRGLPCRSCHHERGGLLLHRFTLATREWRSVFCGTIRRARLTSPAPRGYLAACPLEPGLSSNKYHKGTNARSSDRLPASNITKMTKIRLTTNSCAPSHDDRMTPTCFIPHRSGPPRTVRIIWQPKSSTVLNVRLSRRFLHRSSALG